MIDPVEAFKESRILPIPTMTSGPFSTPIGSMPSVIPDKPEVQKIGGAGENALWVVFFIMLLSSAAFTVMSWKVPVGKRLYYVVTTTITSIAALSYFAMASGHGLTWHRTRLVVENEHVPNTYHDVYRQVFYARYVDWVLTTPLLLLDLSLLAGLNGAHITMAILADVTMVLTGMFAAFGNEQTTQKWGWYAIACVAYLVVIWHLVVNGRAQANAKAVGSFYTSIAGFTIVIWTIYPIIWGISDGSRIMSVNQEVIAYAILDILAKPVFGAWLLLAHRRMDETKVEIGGFWAHGLGGREGLLRLGDDDGA